MPWGDLPLVITAFLFYFIFGSLLLSTQQVYPPITTNSACLILVLLVCYHSYENIYTFPNVQLLESKASLGEILETIILKRFLSNQC